MTSTIADLVNAEKALDARIRGLYALKESGKTLDNVRILHGAIDTTDSVLLQHEILYNIGQFGFTESLPTLEAVVTATHPSNDDGADDNETIMAAAKVKRYDVVSRHEAIESIGAIGDSQSVPFLEAVYNAVDEPAPIRESAELALRRIRLGVETDGKALTIPSGCDYVSVDPSPAFAASKTESREGGSSRHTPEEQLGVILCDESADIFDRYRAMFSLRNINSTDAVLQLCKALRADHHSCLFRHEVAFVLGQMEHPASAPALSEALKDEKEHDMVRHEAAEALGALAEDSTLGLLQAYAGDEHPPLVRDSCVVALEMHKYWSNFKAAPASTSSE